MYSKRSYAKEVTVSMERFFVFEGIDGAGTTTQSKMLYDALCSVNCHAFLTWEPTDSPVGSVIRSILNGTYRADHATLSYLFAADRHDHLWNPDHGIYHMLRRGVYVVQDRYLFSSLAYQSAHSGYDLIYQLNKDFPLPSITFFFDIPVDISIRRLEERNGIQEIFEHQEFQQQLRIRYMRAFDDFSKQTEIVIIDGTGTPEEIHAQVWDRVRQRISMASP